MRKMKDSGIKWIGEVPASWTKKKIKNAVSLIGSGTTPQSSSYQYYENGDIFWIQSGDIYGKTLIIETASMVTEMAMHSLPALRLYEPDFIVIAMYGGSVGNIAISKIPACVNQACCCIQPDKENDLEFMFYWISMCREDFLRVSEGGGQPNISQAKIKNQYYIQPPLLEQKRIATFLDTKCAEIDALIADIQAQIDTLEQYKRSVITEAVTKGLNPDVEMKDSGIEWVGMIPASWHVHPVYYYFGERKNKNYALQEQNLLSLSYGRIIRKDINTNGGLLPASFNTYNIVEPGDIIIRPTDLQNDKRSLRTGFVIERGIITSAYIDLMPKENVNSKYFHYLLHSFDVQKVFYNMGNGVRQGLNYSEFAKLMIFEPSLREQNVIVDFLDKKCAEIDATIVTKQEQMTTLADYKKSLIYEYVTGKKEVPQAAADKAAELDPQVILLGILINKLGRDIRGKIQLQKMLYLTNEYVGLNRGVQYYRYAHGPYDLQLEQYVDILVSNHWYEEKHQGADLLLAGKNHADFVEKYGDRFNDKQAEIDKLIDFLGPMKTSQVERIATLFAAWNDFIIDGNPAPTDSQIIHEVMNNWTDNKAHTQYATWQGTLKKMKKHGIVPKGLGLHTLPKA
ncbi:restriction endonuclease subunit S [Bariatricus sp. HCP28S3_E4]|uniref:restriction endonuclease subunit S n=1 Tax=unclassified Bariatricus TaxID=2677046 RepID=UPI003F89346D